MVGITEVTQGKSRDVSGKVLQATYMSIDKELTQVSWDSPATKGDERRLMCCVHLGLHWQ